MRGLSARKFVLGGAGLAAVAVFLVFGISSALGADFVVTVSKGCGASTGYIGDPYLCHSTLKNADPQGDNYLVQSASDKVNSSGGAVTQDLFANHTPIVFHNNGGSAPVACTNGAGAGTVASPFIPTAATQCVLPGDPTLAGNGGSITFGNPDFSHYTVLPGDYTANAAHSLTDQITYGVSDLCNVSGSNGCDTTQVNPENANGSVIVKKRGSQASTTILNAAQQPVTTVEAGSIVHDSGSVSENTVPPPATLGPVPTGSVSINFFNNIGCTGNAAASGSAGLDAFGNFNATGFPQGPLAAGQYSFQATYTGDGYYNASPAGPCEPLTVVDANIQLTPPTATNRVGSNHTLTCHINVNDGTGQVNAPDGTVCTVAITSGPGSPASQNCTMNSGNGSCNVVISSAVTGTSTINASTNVTVGGLVLHRATGDGKPGDSPNASKLWVNAAIVIAPNATNEINHNHTFTATLLFDTGSGLAPAGAGQPVTVTLTGTNGANPSPAGPFNLLTDANGQVSVTFTSSTPGQVTGHASWTGSVAGEAPFTVQTDGTGSNSGDATKTFVDANIQISPANATNPLNTNHVLTCHINVNDGSGAGYVNAPDGTICTVAIISGPGTPTTQNCTVSGGLGNCSATITSSTAGTSVIRASTSVVVGGVTLNRHTGDANVGDGPDAHKIWIAPDANIQISPQTAQDPVGDQHTLTGHVNVAPDGSTFSNAPAGTEIDFHIISGPGSFVGGVDHCLTIGTTGSCTVQITSAVAGTTVIRATTDVTVSGVSLHRETNDGHAGDSSDANKTWIPPGGIIAPTQTSCSDVLNGTFSTLGQINYSLSGGVIGQGINPGVFFYYTKITTTIPNQVVTVTQSNTSTNNTPLFGALNGQAWLWKGDCSSHTTGALIQGGAGATFTVPTPGNYIIGIKYQTKTIAGAPAPVPANITYNFVTSLGGATGASVLLKKQ